MIEPVCQPMQLFASQFQCQCFNVLWRIQEACTHNGSNEVIAQTSQVVQTCRISLASPRALREVSQLRDVVEDLLEVVVGDFAFEGRN